MENDKKSHNYKCKHCDSSMTPGQYKKNGRTCNRCARYWEKYRIRVPDYERLYDKQGGRCAICNTSTPKTPTGSFCIDHCHATDTIRGLLCINCNTGIGSLKEDFNILESAIKYLANGNTYGN